MKPPLRFSRPTRDGVDPRAVPFLKALAEVLAAATLRDLRKPRRPIFKR
jgi:hypothetical protein